jgi:hypothetical protein
LQAWSKRLECGETRKENANPLARLTQWLDKSFADLIAAIAKKKSIDSALVLPAARAVVDDGAGNGWQTHSTWSMHRGSCQD